MRNAVMLLCVLMIFCNSGCYSIRKKFIRKRKYEKEPSVYVDFKDYPQKPSRSAYIDYYLFVRGWLDELAGALRKGSSYKREKRAINEVIMNLEQIISFYNQQGKNQIYPLYEELLEIKEEIKKAPNMGEVKSNNLIRKIEYIKRRFEKDFNYTDTEQWIN